MPYHGLFWMVPDEEPPRIISYKLSLNEGSEFRASVVPTNSRKGDALTHRHSWSLAAQGMPRGIRNKPWNYYPRGRVEFNGKKVIVYHNPGLCKYSKFKETIIREFELHTCANISFRADHSWHYRSLSDGGIS